MSGLVKAFPKSSLQDCLTLVFARLAHTVPERKNFRVLMCCLKNDLILLLFSQIQVRLHCTIVFLWSCYWIYWYPVFAWFEMDPHRQGFLLSQALRFPCPHSPYYVEVKKEKGYICKNFKSGFKYCLFLSFTPCLFPLKTLRSIHVPIENSLPLHHPQL